MSKKVVIVGAGLAGLSAGIYARQAGYDVEIYEKNLEAGGCCSAWKRGPYTIDNCIHWMTGTLKDSMQYKIWKNLGALSDDTKYIKRESFLSCEYQGQKITLWRDIERTKKEMLELSPEDEKEILRFIDYTRLASTLQQPYENFTEVRNAFNDFNSYVPRSKLLTSVFEYVFKSSTDMAKQFKHPLLQKLFTDFMCKDYESYWLVLSYSIFVANNGDIPEGGSAGVVERMVKTFKDLGGKLYLGLPVSKIVLSKQKFTIDKEVFSKRAVDYYKVRKITARNAEGILLVDETFVEADYVICACDIFYTFGTLLKRKYAPASIRRIKHGKCKSPIYSSFQTAFAVQGEMPEVDQLTFSCRPVNVAKETYDRICVKNYRCYGDYIAPKGETVIQVSLVQYVQDYEYWHKLRQQPVLYKKKKNEVAHEILARIEERFPEYRGKIKLIDCWTPYTYHRMNNCYYGAYMRFITTATNRNAFLPIDVKDLRNVFLASHWLRYPGGIPTASALGGVVVNRIKHLDEDQIIRTKVKKKLQKRRKQLEKQYKLAEEITS